MVTHSVFSTLSELRHACSALPPADHAATDRIRQRDATLTKPPGSLGRLEELALWLGAWQRRAEPRLDRVRCIIFAGNHGVVRQGVSAWPSDVTAAMTANFRNGGAAICQLSAASGTVLKITELEDLRPAGDFSTGPAMTMPEFLRVVSQGYAAVDRTTDLLCLGEMGIGNTTPAAALAAALCGGTGADWAGPGAGSSSESMKRKVGVIDAALRLHGEALKDPLEAARLVGGYELAAIMGAVLAARQHHIPVFLDGFVCTAAAAPLHFLTAGALDHCRIAHCSAEPGHIRLAEKLHQKPLLDFGLRLGEASGAVLAVPLLRAALACHLGMHSFEEAGIAAGQDA